MTLPSPMGNQWLNKKCKTMIGKIFPEARIAWRCSYNLGRFHFPYYWALGLSQK